MNVITKKPKTEEDFQKYYDLRWRMLRKPWNQPRGTKKDEFEKTGIHLAIFIDGEIIGCGRGHFNSKNQAQIRYLAVDEKYQAQGLGTRLLQALEEKLFAADAIEIIAKVRRNAVPLYKKNGYEITGKGEILFGEIEHFWMRKIITTEHPKLT